ncbi:MAG: hypothetical protein H6835_11350 [Planctomycetes bacterium]|nr:hypothetical protein [Planctomycetota bacterium]
MRTTHLLALAALASGLAAQSNTVPGLDGHLEILDNITYWGRRGAAYPGGQVGLSMRNTMCNPGSVSIPWYAAMQSDHPKFGFLITRLVGDRMEQVNEWSYCKHAFTSASTSGACGPCNGIGGTNMGVTCSDTYSAGNNASQYWLGPPEEINPWLGTWNPVGSYFDQGDPAVGSPANMDGNRSLTNGQVSAFDDVKNRVTVLEQDLITPGATYFYAIQLIHAGEAVDNRWDNIKYRGFTPTWTGSSWNVANSGVGETFGSVLEAWPGATVNSGGNGNDDGRFFVGCKVTPLGGNLFHYEYAVHNVDNHRAGATFRVPIDASATASNFTFRDIDQDLLNEWTMARVGNEIVFSAPAGNPLEWNTIYNFGFDADYPPGNSYVTLDEARIGPGNLSVDVVALVPGGSTIATWSTFGAGCQGSGYIPPVPCPSLNPGGGTLQPQYSPNEYTYRVSNTGAMDVNGFDIFTASTGGVVNVPAHIYQLSGSFYPALTPVASTTVTIGATPGWYTATFANPVPVNGVFWIGLDTSAQTASVSSVTTGSTAIVCTRPVGGPTWTITTTRAAFTVDCSRPLTYLVPQLGIAGEPALGTSYDVTLADALPNTFAACVSGWSDSSYLGVPLPVALPGAPACQMLVSLDSVETTVVDANGNSSKTIQVPNAQSLVGVDVYHQWAVLDLTANALGLVTTNGGHGTFGN